MPRRNGLRRTGGGFITQGTFVKPPSRRTVSASPPRSMVVPRSVVAPRGDFIPYYNPARIVDLDRLKVVSDMRQSGSERGETQTGDDGVLSPSESRSGTIAAPGSSPGKTSKVSTEKNNLFPVALAVAAYILFGG